MLFGCKWGSRGKEELFLASLMVRKGDQLRHQRWRCIETMRQPKGEAWRRVEFIGLRQSFVTL